jgi:rod shape-determining protein MreB
MGLFSFFNKEVAMDLGTANSIVIYNDQIVVDEPSIVAVDRNTGHIIAVGKRAQSMAGKTDNKNIETIRPLRGGVIADFEMAQHLIRELIGITRINRSFMPPSLRMVICIPSGITNVEERAVRESAEQAGAKEIRMIHEPMAAALGIGIDVLEPEGHMIVDIGGGTAEIAVISLGGIVCNNSIFCF